MDLELCQLDKLYLSNLSSYNHVLNQRNKLLKDIAFQESLKDTLEIWDEQFVQYGKEIIETRRRFIDEINGIMEKIHSSITGNREKIELVYEPSVSDENFLSGAFQKQGKGLSVQADFRRAAQR